MTVKTGTAWAGTFVTLDSTGALAAGTPAGVLYVDGVANAATVTISGSNPYKWSVTLPSLTAGQRVDMYITATIATIATAGVVASDQADTSLLSDGVIVASGTVTTLTNLPAITANWLTGTGVDATAVTKLQANLALEATLTAIKGAGWSTETLAAIDVLIDAIKLKTDNLPANTTTTLSAIQADLDNPNQYKADVSGLATAVSVAAIPTAPLLAANYTAPDNATITTIAGNVDDLETRLTAARAGYLDNLNTGVALTAAGVDAILDEAVIGSYTVRQLLKVLAAKMVGKATGGGTTSITYRGVDDASNVVVETVDANGNRSAVTLTV